MVRVQVNVIKVTEVNITNAIKDQTDSAAAEKSMQKQWTKKLADAQKKLAQGQGTAPCCRASVTLYIIQNEAVIFGIACIHC